jgi:hypothetical protein
MSQPNIQFWPSFRESIPLRYWIVQIIWIFIGSCAVMVTEISSRGARRLEMAFEDQRFLCSPQLWATEETLVFKCHLVWLDCIDRGG